MDHTLIVNFTVVIGAAAIVATVFNMLRLPAIVGFLTAGILVGPNALGVVSSLPEVKWLTEIGGILLMFSIGLEFSLKRIFSLRKVLINLGLVQVLITIAVVAVIGQALIGLERETAWVFGTLIAMSSTAVVIKLLYDHRHRETPFGNTSIAILLSQDFAAIPILIFLPLIAAQTAAPDSNLGDLQSLATKTGLIIGLLILGARYVVPFFIQLVTRTKSREIFFFSVLFICSGTALVSQELGLSLSIGAFFAGLMLAETPYSKQILSDFAPLRDNFLGIFFVSVGMLLDPHFILFHFLEIVGLLAGTLILKFILLFCLLWLLGNPASIAIPAGLILCQMGEFSIIIAEEAFQLKLLNPDQRQFFLALTVGSLALTPLLYQLALSLGFTVDYTRATPKIIRNVALRLRESLSRTPFQARISSTEGERHPMEGHTVLIGFGLGAQSLASALEELKIPYQIVEMNQQTVQHFARQAQPILYGDATQADILHEVNIETAKLAVIAVYGAEISAAIHRTIRKINPSLPVVVRTQHLRDLVHFPEDTNTTFVIAEFEATLELTAETMTINGVAQSAVDQFVRETRQRLLKQKLASRSIDPGKPY